MSTREGGASPKMSSCFPWRVFFSLLLYLIHPNIRMTCGCFVEEREALMDIRTSLTRANATVPRSWGRGDDCCSWERVKCSSSTRRVSHLYFSNLYDYTKVPTGAPMFWRFNNSIFSAFPELQFLDLSYNYPSSLSFDVLQNLTNLQVLNLSNNGLNGSLPMSLLALPRLKILDLSYNSLAGSIPISLSSEPVSLKVLNLSNNNMNGSLPTKQAFQYLSNLRELHLGSNQLSGNISTFLLSLPHLERLDFSQNNLSGRLSFFWLQNLTKLEEIDLSENTNLAVDVNVPGWVPQFQLKKLALSSCDLDKGIIAEPHFLRTQHNLQWLDLSNNNLSGSMPNWLFTKEATLVDLYLANNSLTGSLSPIWHPQSALESFDISTNHIAGKLPANFSSIFPSLFFLNLSDNNFFGEIPMSLCQLNNMGLLELSNNDFSGEMPACVFTDFPNLNTLRASNNQLGGLVLGGMKNLSIGFLFIDFHDNKLSGELDTSFWNLSNLVVLDLSGNRITGNIPQKVCSLPRINTLDLSDNGFTGPVPRCSSASLTSFNLSINSLSGDISGDLFNTSNLVALDMRYNKLTGDLNWLQHFDKINILSLGWNKFEGQITPNLCKLKGPTIIDFSHNNLSGSLPPCVGNICYECNKGLTIFYNPLAFTFGTKGAQYTYGLNFMDLMSGIDLSGNMLSGEIPWEMGNLSHIISLNLSNNFFTGQIPSSFAGMSMIESLDLSYNELSGSIPSQLTKLWSLAVFSVAYNNLSGCIPNSGQFSSFSIDSYQGNNNLHVMSQGNICSPDSGAGDLPSEGSNREEDDPVLYAISAASFVLAFWATIAFIVFHPLGRHVVIIVSGKMVPWYGV